MSFPVLIYRWGVYHWEDFRFKDGSSKDKYWIALVCKVIHPKTGSEELIPSLIPTSQWEKYKAHPRWLIDTVVLEPGESKFFPKRTILDLKNIQWVKEETVYHALKNRKLTYLGTLEESIIIRVEKAIREAETLSPKDIKILLCE
ncbi:MAG: hypothetical protein ABGX17_01965 [Desulfurobacteriaceae bacterium]